MKRLIKPILILLVLCLICASGCKGKQDPEEFMFERVSKIPIEIPGYALVKCDSEDEEMIALSGEIFIIDEEEIYVDLDPHKIIISFQDREFILDLEYMKTNSAYETVRTTWNAYKEDYSSNYTYPFFGATVFDNKLFIIARCVNWVAYNSYPITFYYVDLTDYIVYYAGYYTKSYNEVELKVINAS